MGGINMSEKSYKKAKKLIIKNEDLADFEGKKPISYIEKAESLTNLKISGFYLDFLQEFGAGNFGSEEIFGIIDDDYINSSVPDAIWYTLTLRNSGNLPSNFLVIYDNGSDEIYCLDFNNVGKTGEPKVVSIDLGYDLDDQDVEIIAEDFGDFLLELVESELD